MTKKLLMILMVAVAIIAIAVPVSAVWQNGNWIEDAKAPDAVYDPVTDVSSKYVPIIPEVDFNYGGLYITVMSHATYGLDGEKMIIQRFDDTKLPAGYVSGDRVLKENFALFTPNGENMTLALSPNGKCDVRFSPGTYGIELLYGSTKQPEYAVVTISPRGTSYVTFIGYIITQDEPTTKKIRANPLDASIDAFFGRNDVTVKFLKLVKTGEHVVPAYDTTEHRHVKVIDQEAVPGIPEVPEVSHTDYRYVITPAVPAQDAVISGWVTTVPVGTDIVDQKTVITQEAVPAADATGIPCNSWTNGHVHAQGVHSSPYDFIYNGHAYEITGHSWDDTYLVTPGSPAIPEISHLEYKYVITPAIPAEDAVISDWVCELPDGSDIFESKLHITQVFVPAVPAVPEISHMEQQEYTVHHPEHTVNEYGIEFFVKIDGAHVAVNNPNNDKVNVDFNFDVNYWIDTNPGNNNAMPGQIESRSETYYGSETNVGTGITTYHGVLHPNINPAVEVLGWDGLNYVPYISNEQITSTVWS